MVKKDALVRKTIPRKMREGMLYKGFLRTCPRISCASRRHGIGHHEIPTSASRRRLKPLASALSPLIHSFIQLPRDGVGVTVGMAGVTVTYGCRDCSVSNLTGSSAHLRFDEDDELLKYIWSGYLYPKQYEWVLIVAYIVVFLCSLIGNTLGKFQMKQSYLVSNTCPVVTAF